MNDPQAIRYVNEVIRPLSERLRDLRDDLTNALATWHGTGIGAAMQAKLDDPIVDAVREKDGVANLICNDAVLTIALAEQLLAVLNGAGKSAVIAKPCVRAMRGTSGS